MLGSGVLLHAEEGTLRRQCRPHDVPVRCWAYESEGVTRNQREGWLRSGFEYFHILWLYNPRGLNDVHRVAAALMDLNCVARPNPAQRTKKRIAMRRQDGVSLTARQRGTREVSGSALQYILIGSFKYDGGKIQPRNLQPPNNVAGRERFC